MYKKIKNGSFMNLFWFIICLMPLILFLISSINTYNKNNIVNENSIENLYVNNQTNNYVTYNENINAFKLKENRSASAIITPDFTLNYELNKNYYLYYTSQFLNDNPNYHLIIYYKIYDENNNQIGNQQHFTIENNSYILNFTEGHHITFYLRNNLTNRYQNNDILYIFLSEYQINNDNLLSYFNQNGAFEYNSYYYNLIFNVILNNFYNTFASNGFINNTLIQVLNYFNVNNVYMKLAILYIEYFIIIQLLHLFVDFMLLIPNICHKFMEKVGGEHD